MPEGIDLTEITGYSTEDGRLLVELVSLIKAGYVMSFKMVDTMYSREFMLTLMHNNVKHAVQTVISMDKIEEFGVQYFIEELWKSRYAMEHPDKLED